MNGWVYFAIYVAGFVVTWRIAFCVIIEFDRKDALDLGDTSYEPDPQARMEIGGAAAIAAFLWWLALPLWLLWRLVAKPALTWITRPTRPERKRDQALAEKAELKKLRAMAEEMGLPLEPRRDRGRLARSTDKYTEMFSRDPNAPKPRFIGGKHHYVLNDPEGERIADLIAEHGNPYRTGDSSDH